MQGLSHQFCNYWRSFVQWMHRQGQHFWLKIVFALDVWTNPTCLHCLLIVQHWKLGQSPHFCFGWQTSNTPALDHPGQECLFGCQPMQNPTCLHCLLTVQHCTLGQIHRFCFGWQPHKNSCPGSSRVGVFVWLSAYAESNMPALFVNCTALYGWTNSTFLLWLTTTQTLLPWMIGQIHHFCIGWQPHKHSCTGCRDKCTISALADNNFFTGCSDKFTTSALADNFCTGCMANSQFLLTGWQPFLHWTKAPNKRGYWG